MTTMDEVAALALALPGAAETTSYGHRAWGVGTKTFAWERPFTKADVKRYGAQRVPEGDILAVHVADLGEKDAVLAEGHSGFFTTPHFDGYPAILVELALADLEAVHEVVVDGWLDCAPEAVAAAYAAGRWEDRSLIPPHP